MTRVLAVFVVGGLEALASAQPEPLPPSADPPSVAPGTTEPIVTTSAAHDMAVRMTSAARDAAAQGKCALIDRFDARVRELDAVYYEQVFAVDATIARCRPAVAAPGLVALAAPGMVAVAEPPPHRSALTIEAGIGAGMSTDGEIALRGFGGPAFGIGGFVTPTLAVSARLSGSLAFVDGAFYVGVLGPNVQLWTTDNFWLGGGIGLAVAAGCGEDDCDHVTGVGVDARFGYAFRRRGQSGVNVSLELMHESFDASSGGITTAAVMLGYQTF